MSSIEQPIGFGCMRLSTAADRDEELGVATIRTALDAGATLLDTADAYALDARDAHHNERLVARALAGRTDVRVVTKGGLCRPGGQWVPDGRAVHLRRACAESAAALGGGAIPLYLLHAPDPRTDFATSVRALAQLRDEGMVREVGLSNVTLAQIREAEAIVPIAAVEVELSPWVDAPLRSGIVEHCAARGILLLAHSPLGGPQRARRLSRDPVLAAVADRRGVSAAAVALAWLRSLAPGVVPIPGARTPDRAGEVVAAARLTLDAEDRAALEARFPAAAALRTPRAGRRPPDDADGDVVLVVGIQGAGKSEIARGLVEQGYQRLNRDERGGTLRDLLPVLAEHLAAGRRRVVLDNTHATRALRNEVVEVAWRHGVPVRCLLADTPIEVAQVNAVRRLIERHGGTLPMPEEIARAKKKDPAYLLPGALHRMKRELERPELDEGYRAVEHVPFVRRGLAGPGRSALFVALDAIARLADPPRPESLQLLPHARQALLAHRPGPDAAIHVFAWAPAIARGAASPADLGSCAARLRDAIDLPLAVAWCPHPEGPPICWCRPPLPGLLVAAMQRDGIDPRRTVLLGTTTPHRTLARALDVEYRDAEQPVG